MRTVRLLATSLLTSASNACLSDDACNGRGYCDNGTCSCYEFSTDDAFTGWTGPSCSQRLCRKGLGLSGRQKGLVCGFPTSECGGEGTCDRQTGECACNDLFTGDVCTESSCPIDCKGRGDCVYEFIDEPGRYVNTYFCNCSVGFSGESCVEELCPSSSANSIPCGEGWNGHGICDSSDGGCHCFPGFSGASCVPTRELLGDYSGPLDHSFGFLSFGFFRGTLDSCSGNYTTTWPKEVHQRAIELRSERLRGESWCGTILVRDPVFYSEGLYYVDVTLNQSNEHRGSMCVQDLRATDVQTWNQLHAHVAAQLNASVPSIFRHGWCAGVNCTMRLASTSTPLPTPLPIPTGAPTNSSTFISTGSDGNPTPRSAVQTVASGASDMIVIPCPSAVVAMVSAWVLAWVCL